MKQSVLVALIASLVDEAIKSIDLPQAERGPRGLRGKSGADGNNFRLADHKEELKTFIDSAVPKFLELSEEDLAKIKGERGPRGLSGKSGQDGKDGKDGKDFSLEESLPAIQSTISDFIQEQKELFKLKFSDLNEEEKRELKGSRGQRGKAGRDFDFEEHRSEIESLIEASICEAREALRLKFSDLDAEEKAELKGERGKSGRDGRDFIFEDEKENLQKIVLDNKEELRLKFVNLSDEEKEELKLRFEHLTPEDLAKIKGDKGARGQRGKQGEQGPQGEKGAKGERGERGIRGLPGLTGMTGPQGPAGRDGRDGADAPQITSVEIEKIGKDEFLLEFEFSDGTYLKTNSVKLPATTVYNQYVSGGIGRGGGGGGTGVISIQDEENEITSNAQTLNFTGPAVVVRPRVPLSEWPTLSEVEPSIADYLGGGEEDVVDVHVSADEGSDKLRWALESIKSFDKEVSVVYENEGSEAQRVTQVLFTSPLFPNAVMTKNVYYVEMGNDRRIERVEYFGSVLRGASLRKIFNYSPLGNRTGYRYEVF